MTLLPIPEAVTVTADFFVRYLLHSLCQKRLSHKPDITAAATSFDEARYYEMDSALNLAMATQRELLDAVGRLRETEVELAETKKKVLFLQKTRRVRITIKPCPERLALGCVIAGCPWFHAV